MNQGLTDQPIGSDAARSDDRTYSVVHFIDSLGRSGGAEQQLVVNLHHFTDPGFRHRVVCIYRGETSREGDLPPGVTVSYLRRQGRRVRSRMILIVLAWWHFRQLRPDLIHCVLPDASLAARLAGRFLHIPVVESLVNISHEELRIVDNPAVKRWKLLVHRFIDRRTMPTVAAFQALSEEVARSWVETVAISRSRIEVIPRSVETKEVDRETSRAHILEELALAGESFLILNVGRQVPQKGQIYAIRALPQIVRAVPAAVFVSVGSAGSVSRQLRLETERLGVADIVYWLGVRDDVPELMAAADVFVFPSLYEGFGVSLLQAMAAGLACLASHIPPISEIVTHGTTGLLVPPRDPGALTAALTALASDRGLLQALGQNARRHALETFGPQEIGGRIEAMYRMVLSP